MTEENMRTALSYLELTIMQYRVDLEFWESKAALGGSSANAIAYGRAETYRHILKDLEKTIQLATDSEENNDKS